MCGYKVGCLGEVGREVGKQPVSEKSLMSDYRTERCVETRAAPGAITSSNEGQVNSSVLNRYIFFVFQDIKKKLETSI